MLALAASANLLGSLTVGWTGQRIMITARHVGRLDQFDGEAVGCGDLARGKLGAR
jgi:hypothetical protein